MSRGRSFIGVSSAGGRIVGTIVFLIFAGMGALFAWLIARETWRAAETRRWHKTECVIVSSQVTEVRDGGGPSYRFDVRYEYTWQGKRHTGDRHRRAPTTSADYTDMQRLVEKFPADTKTFCQVNPADPSEAVLAHQTLWIALAIVFPAGFVFLGLGGLYYLWRRSRESAMLADQPPRPLTARAGWGGRLFAPLFFAVFFLAGCGAFYAFFVKPVRQIVAAKDWIATPCTVISSEVKTHSGEDGSTYSVNILYEYEVNGQTYKSNRYKFMTASSSGVEAKARIVRRYPPGLKTTCFVNPRDPTDAVIERALTADMWLGLIPLLFVLVGAGGIYGVLRGWPALSAAGAKSANRANVTGVHLGAASPVERGLGPVRLKARTSRGAMLAGSIFIALFWNGIVSVFVWQVIQSWRRGSPEWFLTIFVIPFVLIGLLLIGFVGRTCLQLFNPRVELTATPGALPLGGRLDLHWRVAGQVARLDKLRLTLEGREEVTYRRGTKTVTDKRVFAAVDLASITNKADLRSGQARATIPADTMHSFAATNNKIIWSLRVRGEIPRWPDIDEEYPITVLPHTTGHAPPP